MEGETRGHPRFDRFKDLGAYIRKRVCERAGPELLREFGSHDKVRRILAHEVSDLQLKGSAWARI